MSTRTDRRSLTATGTCCGTGERDHDDARSFTETWCAKRLTRRHPTICLHRLGVERGTPPVISPRPVGSTPIVSAPVGFWFVLPLGHVNPHEYLAKLI